MTAARSRAERFPYPHRTVAETGSPSDALCLKLDRISTVPILNGPWPHDCWQFLFVIPGDR